jgi:hypothetical protein
MTAGLPSSNTLLPPNGGLPDPPAPVMEWKYMRVPRVPSSSAADPTEKALLRATRAAQTAYERGAAESKPMLRQAWLHALRAFRSYLTSQELVPTRPVQTPRADSAERCRTLLAICGLE